MSALLLDLVASLDLASALGYLDYGSGTDDGAPGWLLALGPASAVAVYTGLYRYYRNTDKSHHFERETVVQAQPVTGSDQKIDEVRGTKRRSIQGDNGRKHRERVQRVQ